MDENILVSPDELPMTETEEVDVVVVENGELKRKSGVSFGGGTDELDLELEFVLTTANDLSSEVGSIISGNVPNVVNKIRQGLKPNVLVRHISNDLTTYEAFVNEYKANVSTYGEHIYLSYISCDGLTTKYSTVVRICSDNTINYAHKTVISNV